MAAPYDVYLETVPRYSNAADVQNCDPNAPKCSVIDDAELRIFLDISEDQDDPFDHAFIVSFLPDEVVASDDPETRAWIPSFDDDQDDRDEPVFNFDPDDHVPIPLWPEDRDHDDDHETQFSQIVEDAPVVTDDPETRFVVLDDRHDEDHGAYDLEFSQDIQDSEAAPSREEEEQGGPGDYEYGSAVARRARRQALGTRIEPERQKGESPSQNQVSQSGKASFIRLPSGQIVRLDQLSDTRISDDDLAILLLLESDRLI